MPTRYNSYDLIRTITKEGWYCVTIRGSHHKFKHRSRPGIVVVPHPKSFVPPGTASQILKAAGCRFEPNQ